MRHTQAAGGGSCCSLNKGFLHFSCERLIKKIEEPLLRLSQLTRGCDKVMNLYYQWRGYNYNVVFGVPGPSLTAQETNLATFYHLFLILLELLINTILMTLMTGFKSLLQKMILLLGVSEAPAVNHDYI